METNIFEGAYFVLNSDNKVELHLNGKDHYQQLPEDVKKKIKSGFIWGRQRGAWVSRAIGRGIPYQLQGYNIPLKEVEERKEYLESREQKIDRAEHKAERFEKYAESREREAESLQAEFNRLRKDWSWLTQPNVNTSGGRSFTRSRERVMAKYTRGFESLDKAKQHREYAAALKITASEQELSNEGYLVRRVLEGRKAARMFDKFLKNYAVKLESIDEQPTEWKVWLKSRMNWYETAFEKLDFFEEALKELAIKKQEAGHESVYTIEERLKTLKKEVKAYLKARYNIDLVKFSKAFGVGVEQRYVIRTVQPLPERYHSGWAADNVAQVPVALLIKDIDEFNAQ